MSIWGEDFEAPRDRASQEDLTLRRIFVSTLLLAGCAQAPPADPMVQARCCLSLPQAALLGPPAQGQKLVLHLESDQPAAVLVVALKGKELAPEVLPQVVSVNAGQESAGDITYDSASKLYVAFLPADSNEAREAARWVANPSAPELYDHLSIWITEKNLGLAQTGPPVHQIGAVKFGALKPPNVSPPKESEARKTPAGGGGSKVSPVADQLLFDWHGAADRVVFGPGHHGVKVYTLNQL